MTPMPDKEVTEDDNANDTAGGSFTVTDAEQTSAVTVQRCVDAAAGTACTAFANAATGNIGGIYGNFTLTNAGVWDLHPGQPMRHHAGHPGHLRRCR